MYAEQYPFPRGDSAVYRLDTPIGSPFVRSLGEHIGVQGGIPHNTLEGAGGALTINGVEYSVQAHFHRWADGRFHAGAEDSRENWREPHISRREYNPDRGYSGNEPTAAARKRAREVLEAAVNDWADAHPDALLSGAEQERAQNAHHLARQLDTCEQACEVLRANLERCTSGQQYLTYPLKSQPELER